MLTLFVVQSCADPKEPEPAIKSFEGLAGEIYFVPNIQAINEQVVKDDWYAVIYDDEWIDEHLLEGLKVFIKDSPSDVLVLYKKNGERYFKGTRLFRRDVMLRKDVLLPANKGLEFDTVLNGFVHGN